MSRWQEMSSFVAVAEAGSFVGAVESSGLSKAALSRHVAALEQRLGVRLLHRTTRRLSLTDDGQRFLERARELLAGMEAAEAELHARTAEVSGRVRVNAPLSFGVLQLAPLWPGFIARHPNVRLDVILNDRLVDLVDEGYDLAVRITNLPSSQLVSRRLASTRMIACASPDYLREHGSPGHPSELAAHRVIGYSLSSSRDEWSFHGSDGELRVRTRPFMHTNNGDTCRIAALQGQGVILQPDFIVGADLREGTLVEVLPQWQTQEFGIHAVYASRRQLPTRVRALIDFLAESLREPDWA